MDHHTSSRVQRSSQTTSRLHTRYHQNCYRLHTRRYQQNKQYVVTEQLFSVVPMTKADLQMKQVETLAYGTILNSWC